jgi:hypothetical protein
MFAIKSVLAQQPAPPDEKLRAKLDDAALVLDSPRLKGLSPRNRQALVEFVAGNMLFVLLHELAHAAVAEMAIAVLGRDEDAADSFAATRLIGFGAEFSKQMVADSAKGWFLSDRRNKRDGDLEPYYDAHGLDLQRAYQFVCYLVGADPAKFKSLADETKLPRDRQESCKVDYTEARKSWDVALTPHRRAPDQPKINISVIYGDGKGKRLELIAKAMREIGLLEPVAEVMAEQYAWPASFTLEMKSCGFINAAWVASTRKLTLCYELAADFGDLYRAYGLAPTNNGKRRSK